jgi:hypothetical protein
MSEHDPFVGHAPLSGALLPSLLSGLLAACLAILVGCAAPTPKPPKIAQSEPPAPKPVDPSYDWRGLLPAPFGSYLKAVPLALHEVLLFRDQSQGGAGSPDDAECYGTDTAAPRFVGGTPDEYLLCFKQDRLARIRASVSVHAEQAPEIFATACALWLKNAGLPVLNAAPPPTPVPPSSAASAPGSAPAPTGAPQSPSTCEGRDGAVHFSGRLGEEPGSGPAETPPAPARDPEAQPAETLLRIVLDGAHDTKTLSE